MFVWQSVLRSLRIGTIEFAYRLSRWRLFEEPKTLSGIYTSEPKDNFAAYQKLGRLLTIYLQGSPYWFRGHLELGELSLLTRNLVLAENCAAALGVLAKTKAQHRAAKLLQAKCAVRSGRFPEAVAALRELRAVSPDNIEVAEELIAAYLGQGLIDEAKLVLERVPESSRNLQLRSVAEFIR